MYNTEAITSYATGPDLIYVQRLRENLLEVTNLKQAASDSKDFVQTEKLGEKEKILQEQLLKLEDQFSSEILQNSLTQWVQSYMNYVLDHITSPSKLLEQQILSLPFHEHFIHVIKGLPLAYYDSLARALLILIPHDLPEVGKSPYGWESLAKKLQESGARSQDIMDLSKTILILLVMDLISILMGGSNKHFIKNETYYLTLRHIFHQLHIVAGRRLVDEKEKELMDKAFTRFAVTVGYISRASGAKDIFRFVMFSFDPVQKTAPEELVLLVSVLRYSFEEPTGDTATLEYVDYIKELIVLCDKNKRIVIKQAIIKLLERVVQPFIFKNEKTAEDLLIWSEIEMLFKKARKWSTAQELRQCALHLMTIIMVNSRMNFFAANIDSFLCTDLCSKMKVRPYAYECLLQLLRGRYYQDTLMNYEDAIRGTYLTGRHFSFLTRAPAEESFDTVSNRLNSITNMMFFQRKYPIPEEYLDISVAIAVQVAAHNIALGAKTISQLLDTTRMNHSSESYYVALKALRIILDPDSGFKKFAYSNNDPECNMILQEFPYNLEPSIGAIYSFLEDKIGVVHTGASGKVLELPTDVDVLNPYVVDPDASTASSIKLHSQSTSLMVLDDNESATAASFPPTPKSRQNILSTSRGSLISSLASLHNETSHKPVDAESEVDDNHDYLIQSIQKWFEAVGNSDENVTFFAYSAPLIDRSRIKKNRCVKLSSEQCSSLKLLQELILMIQFIPFPEFIGGKYFIGSFLTFFRNDVAQDVARALINIFQGFTELRLGMLNGFINFLKDTEIKDTISICSYLTVLSKMIKSWNSDVDAMAVSKEGFYRVSCKLDASILYLMSHANSKIRRLCLQIIFDMYNLQNIILPHGTKPGEQPLAYILSKSENLIVKQAIYGFLEVSTLCHTLSANSCTSLHPLTFLEVASSSFTGVFQFYHGELVKRFSLYGRPKAIRHLAKYLDRNVSSMLKESNPSSDEEYTRYYGSCMILLMAMAGTPITSDYKHRHRTKTQEDIEYLLFNCIKIAIPSLLALDDRWEAKLIFKSMYFLNRDVIQQFIIHLNFNFQKAKHNLATLSSTKFLDNLFSMVRFVIQYPHFELLIEEDHQFTGILQRIIYDFIAFTLQPALSHPGFLIEGPIYRVETAINKCIIIRRLCTSLIAVHRKIQRKSRIDNNTRILLAYEATIWKPTQRQTIVSQLKEWYDTVTSGIVLSKQSGLINLANPVDNDKMVKIKQRLLLKIEYACEQLMMLGIGGVFTGCDIPAGIIPWLVSLQSKGFRVFSPDFLLDSNEVMSIVLSSSYKSLAESEDSFTNAIFELLLPRIDDGPHLYMFGKNQRISYVELFLANLHNLPSLESSVLVSPTFIYPELNANDINRIKDHLGSLLFFSIYNLMSSNSVIRLQSLSFLKEIIQVFVAADNNQQEVQTLLQKFTGSFYTSLGVKLKNMVIEISSICSDLFPEDSDIFLWEAVKCTRIVNSQNQGFLLQNPKAWIIEVMIPWCRFVNLGAINIDNLNAHFFRYLMESAFDDPNDNDDIVSCWAEVSSSPDFGIANAAVLMDVIIEVAGRFQSLQRTAFILTSTLASIQPEIVATVLAYHLSSTAFPWNQSKSNHSFQHTSQLAIKEYIKSLHIALNTIPPESSNDYRVNCRSVVPIVSNMLPQQFEAFVPHFGILINYLFINLEGNIKDSSVYDLFKGLIEGFLSYVHDKNLKIDDAILNDVRKLLGLLEMKKGSVIWTISSDLPTAGYAAMEIPIAEFIDRMISTFETQLPSLRFELILEAINYASEGFLVFVNLLQGHDETLHALICYNILLNREQQVSIKTQSFFFSRLLDQLSVLSQLELEAKTIKSTENGKSKWKGLPQGKLKLRDDAVDCILAILKIHFELIQKFHISGNVEATGKLFWVNFGYNLNNYSLLHISFDDCPSIITDIFNNLLFIVDRLDRTKLDDYFLNPLGSQKKSCEVQAILIPHLFCTNSNIREKALLFLLNAWIVFPPMTVDSNKTALLYTTLHSITWIFVQLKDSATPLSDFLALIIKKFDQFLSIFLPKEMQGLQRGLNRILELIKANSQLPKEAYSVLLKQCVGSVFEHYIDEYCNNISQYLSQIICVSPLYQQVGLKMAGILWKITQNVYLDINNNNSLKDLFRRIPFLKEDKEKDELILSIFDDSTVSIIKDVDLASQGRYEPLPGFEYTTGSVRSSLNWLHKDLGITFSNRMFFI